MSRVRFQLLFGPGSGHPYRTRLPTQAGDGMDNGASSGERTGDWYSWRLIGANNRELGRSAQTFGSYPLARGAVRHLQEHADQLIRQTLVDPATGRWGWRLDLDSATVAVSGRWYERDHDSRLGMAKFITLAREADLADGVVTVHDRRGGSR